MMLKLKQNKAKKKKTQTFKVSQKHKKTSIKTYYKIISSNHLIPKSFWPLKWSQINSQKIIKELLSIN